MPNDTIAEQVAARANTLRITEHYDALERLRLLGLPLAAPDPVAVIDAKIAQLVDVYDREWSEFDVPASLQFAESAELLKQARAVSVGVYGERQVGDR